MYYIRVHMDSSPYPLNAKRIATWIVVIAAVAIVYIATAAANSMTETTTTNEATSQGATSGDKATTGTDNQPAATAPNANDTAGSAATPAPTPAVTASSPYKDGSYTTRANYRTPEGSEFVTVTLTLSGGSITDSSISLSNIDFESRRYQGQFENGYKAVVVGQPIADLNLRRVSGSSLTTAAFNNALDTIRSQAQS